MPIQAGGGYGGTVQFFRNIGTPQAAKFEFVQDNFGEVDGYDFSAPALADLDDDGDLDLVVGGGYGTLFIRENIGTPTNPIWKEYKTIGLIDVGYKAAPFAIDLTGDDEEDNEADVEAEKPKRKPAPKPPDPCTILQTKIGWIVQDNSFTDKDLAADRSLELRDRGIPSQWAAQKCIADGRTGWLVWLGGPYPTESEAQTAADNFAKAPCGH